MQGHIVRDLAQPRTALIGSLRAFAIKLRRKRETSDNGGASHLVGAGAVSQRSVLIYCDAWGRLQVRLYALEKTGSRSDLLEPTATEPEFQEVQTCIPEVKVWVQVRARASICVDDSQRALVKVHLASEVKVVKNRHGSKSSAQAEHKEKQREPSQKYVRTLAVLAVFGRLARQQHGWWGSTVLFPQIRTDFTIATVLGVPAVLSPIPERGSSRVQRGQTTVVASQGVPDETEADLLRSMPKVHHPELWR